MKLRNKKTGKVIEALISAYGISGDVAISVMDSNSESGYTDLGRYKTLAEFNEEWEDYKPTEPKLEGEVREIVRHWANLHGYDWLRVGFTERASQRIFWVESPDTRKHVEFLGVYVADDFETGDYSIAELCGEEED